MTYNKLLENARYVHCRRTCGQSGLTVLQGTPIFISRSVSLGKTLGCLSHNIQFQPIPILRGEAKKKYIAAYGAQMYNEWCDEGGKMHGGEPPEAADEDADLPFTHKPCHDVESIYWTLMYTLVKARPAGSPSEDSLPEGVDMVNSLVGQHSIQGQSDEERDDMKRSLFLLTPSVMLDRTLHPMLKKSGLGDLLQKLAQQIAPEYAYLDPPPPVDHLHEAFRRILLETIVDIELHPHKNVALDPDSGRTFAKNSDRTGGKSLGKRTYEDGRLVLPASKRTRSHYGPDAEVNGSRVISSSFRDAAAPSGSKTRSHQAA